MIEATKDTRTKARQLAFENPEWKQVQIARELGVSQGTISPYVSDIFKKRRAAKQKQILHLSRLCWKQVDIAKKLRVTQGTVQRVISNGSAVPVGRMIAEGGIPIKWKCLMPDLDHEDDDVCGVLVEKTPHFYSPAAQKIFERNLARYGQGLFQRDDIVASGLPKCEKEYQSAFAAHLRQTYDNILEQVRCAYGIIDILVQGEGCAIYELKLNPTNSNYIKALGQLLAYKEALHDKRVIDGQHHVDLYFVSNIEMARKCRHLMHNFSIECLYFPYTQQEKERMNCANPTDRHPVA